MKKLFVTLLITLTILMGSVFAEENINITLEQPAVLKAATGQKLEYTLKIRVPESAKRQYESFNVSLMMDSNLKILGTSVKNNDPSYVINNSRLQTLGRDIITISVEDTKRLDRDTSEIAIYTEVITPKAGGEFQNSFVLTTVDNQGRENSTQKDVDSTTKPLTSALSLSPLKVGDKVLKGKTEPGADIIIKKDEMPIATALSDNKGNFTAKLPVLQVGDVLQIEVNYFKDGKFQIIADKITVRGKNDTSEEPVVGNTAPPAGPVMIKLNDFVDFGRKLNVSKASKENAARHMAAVAYGQYMQVKTNVTDDEIQKAIKEIDESQKIIRYPIMNGISKDKFSPNGSLTRAQAAMIISRIDLGKDPVGEYSSFKDVDQEMWYADAVGYMEKNNYISGYKDGTFKPNKKISRAEFAALLSRYLNLGVPGDISFRDVKASDWYYNPIAQMVSGGYMNGKSKNKFDPDKAITRAEALSVLVKVANRTPDREFLDKYSVNAFKDVDKNHWAYYQILEGTGK